MATATAAPKISREHAIELARIQSIVENMKDELQALSERLSACVFGWHGPQDGEASDAEMEAYWDPFNDEADAEPVTA